MYESYSTAEEIEARHRAAGRDPKLGYDNADRDLTEEQNAAFRAEGRRPVLRLRMPDRDISFTDLVRGEITFPAGSVPDFVLVRGDGTPLYPLANPVDDALMGITHVLRGEDLLPSTPRQIALYEALDGSAIGSGAPTFGHLPLVTGEGNRKLSKRDPQSNLFLYRDRGFVPEGLLNYLALLGWSIGRTDRGRVHPRRDGRGVRRRDGCRRTPRGSTSRRPRPSTPRTCGCSRPTTSRGGSSRMSWPSWRARRP